jgi:RNA polymerase sigma factor (sigma-70 family)
MKDIVLLQQFVRENSESAFKGIVDRHLNLVYAAALRQVGDPSLAQDVAQAVFLILSRKASKISANTILSGWLFRTTHFVAAKALRSELRRKHHEQEAAQMHNIQFAAPDRAWEKLAPILNDAMVQLGEKDRNAILLRYFENKDLEGIGLVLGTSEDAAQKRVSRALEKLRRIFSKRGIVLPAVALGSTLAAHATNAAPSLQVGEIIAAKCFSKSIVAPGIYALMQESLRQAFWTTFAKTAGATGLLIVCALFFAENFPKQTDEKKVAVNFGPGNNSIAPKRKPAVPNRFPRVETVAMIAPLSIAETEPVEVLMPQRKSEPEPTTPPVQPFQPAWRQPSVAAPTPAMQSARYPARHVPVVVKRNSGFISNEFTPAPTNDTAKMVPVPPRRFNRPVVNRIQSQRKATPDSGSGDDNKRRLF